MKQFTRLAGIIAAVCLAAVYTAAPASAQASRTWVSGVGDDANPCSRTAPCKTFAGSISKTAAGGEIDCLDPGGFGAVTITKSMTLDCAAGFADGITNPGTNGIAVSAAATDWVKIRNMTINGINKAGTTGIKINSVGSVVIEHVHILNQGAGSNAAVNFAPTNAGAQLYMRDVEVQNNANTGILIKPVSGVAAKALLENVFMVNNGNHGLEVDDGAVVTVDNSQSAGNGGKGYFCNTASIAASIFIESSVSASNLGQGVHTIGANSTVTLSNVDIFNEAIGIGHPTGAVVSFKNNRLYGNTTDGAPTLSVDPI